MPRPQNNSLRPLTAGERTALEHLSRAHAAPAARVARVKALRAIAEDPYMHHPELLGQLGQIAVPTPAVWGDSNRTFTPAYGRALARAIPGAHWSVR